MIRLRDFNTKTEYEFDITIFPDKSSQVWKISPEPEKHQTMEVLWMFENEAELFHVCQLGFLLSNKYKIFPILDVPFLPYGRQDKAIANDATFARKVFITMITEAGYQNIRTYDSHSPSTYIQSRWPTELLEAALPGHDLVCFPDAGAVARYKDLLPESMDWISCEKVRNQQTGEIEGLILPHTGIDLDGLNILVLDDLCDGGRTFIEVAKILEDLQLGGLSLAVSHGVFSRGVEPIYDAGYNAIYTTNSLLKHEHLAGSGMSTAYVGWYETYKAAFQVVEVVNW
jgi:hypothetical protein